jgi:hypothetical protein
VKSAPVGSTELDDFHEAQGHGEHPDKRAPEGIKEGQPHAFGSRPPCAPYMIELDRQNEERSQSGGLTN